MIGHVLLRVLGTSGVAHSLVQVSEVVPWVQENSPHRAVQGAIRAARVLPLVDMDAKEVSG